MYKRLLASVFVMTSWKKSFVGDGPWPVVSNTVLPSRDAMLRRYTVAMATNRTVF